MSEERANVMHLVALGDEHVGCKWKAHGNYRFAAADHAVPVVSTELHLLAARCPLVFMQDESGFAIRAMQGLAQGQNLMVDAVGQWRLDYIPRFYEFRPFCLLEKAPEEYALCIEQECMLPADGAEGELLFEAAGTLAQRVDGIAKGLLQHQQGYRAAQQAVDALAGQGLLISWEPRVKRGDNAITIRNLFKIDEARLAQLDSAALEVLHRSHGLFMAHCQIISMQHMKILETLSCNTTKGGAELLQSLGADGLISFENL